MMGWYGGGMGAGAWVLMGLFWVLLIGAIVWLVVALARSGSRPSGPVPPTRSYGYTPSPGPSALEVLDRRLAAGEVDLETYKQVRAALIETGGAR